MSTFYHRSDRGASNTQLLGTLGGLVLLALLGAIVWAAGRRDAPPPQRYFPVSWSVAPVWPESAEEGDPSRSDTGSAREEARDLAVFLDVSRPIGGFLPWQSTDLEQSPFQALFAQIPPTLVRVSGNTSSSLTYWTVASTVVPVANPQPLRRERFSGIETRLDLAIAELIRGFTSGRLRSAILVTDLIATEDVTGAMGAAKALADWMSASDVRAGRFHLGLLGVHATYRGLAMASCPGLTNLGCRFSEQLQRWVPLQKAESIPFYFLVLGRSPEEVDAIGQQLLAGAIAFDDQARWERLSARAEERPLEGKCELRDPRHPVENQLILIRHSDGGYRCDQGQQVEIACTLPEETGFIPDRARATWPSVRPQIDGDKIVLPLDCKTLRRERPNGELTVTLVGPPPGNADDSWNEWSIENDVDSGSIGKTLQLTSFVATARPRPQEFRMVSGAVLRGGAK